MKKALNENIKDLRMQCGLNQVEFAQKMSVTKQCVSNWENDNIQPSVEMLVQLANIFSVSTDCLLGLEDKSYIEVTGLSDEEIAHVQAIVNDIIKRK